MADLAGQTFGSYRLEGLLGRGGMGEVYRARHLRLANRLAAVKLLPASLATEPDFIRRFEHEANSAASLDHPGILPVWDYGEQDGQPYIAMPLVTGGSLKDLLERRGPLAPREAEAFLVPLADALDYAHSRGILHRDVKPANILLRDDGRPQLADFGIAKAIDTGQSLGLTSAGSGIGTPEYMAPEQIEGRAGPQSDLYSLGVALYQMLSGQLPFNGATPYEVALKQIGAPLPPIRRFRPDLSPAIEAVLNRALAKDPNGRYGSGRQLADAFRAANDQPNGSAATLLAPAHEQRTTPLQVGQETRPLPVAGAVPVVAPSRPVPAPALAPPPAGSYPPAVPPVAGGRARPNTSWPLTVAALLIGALIVGIGAVAAYGAFGGRPDPTATARPATATLAPLLGATETAAANAAASATAAAALLTPTVPPTATQDTGGTATAAAANAGATATANAAATARTAASATSAANAAASATASAAAAVTASRVAALTATANARPSPTLPRTPTNTAVPPTNTPVPPTNTLVPPTSTPVPPTNTPVPPTATKPPTSSWGPALQPLTGGKRYEDGDGRFAFRVPTNWAEGNAQNAEVAFAPPDGSANFAVGLERVPNGTTIEAYNGAAEQQLRAQYPSYTPVSLDKVVVDGHQAYRRVGRATVQGQEVQFEQVYLIDGTVAHVLTFTCRPATFAQLSRTFDGIAGSYTVGK